MKAFAIGLAAILFAGCSFAAVRPSSPAPGEHCDSRVIPTLDFVSALGSGALALATVVGEQGCFEDPACNNAHAQNAALLIPVALVFAASALYGYVAITVCNHRSSKKSTVGSTVEPTVTTVDAAGLAANANAAARDGHCDKAVDLAKRVLALDSTIHINLMNSLEMKRCLVRQNEPLPAPTVP